MSATVLHQTGQEVQKILDDSHDISNMIPEEASSENKLADKNFVGTEVATKLDKFVQIEVPYTYKMVIPVDRDKPYLFRIIATRQDGTVNNELVYIYIKRDSSYYTVISRAFRDWVDINPENIKVYQEGSWPLANLYVSFEPSLSYSGDTTYHITDFNENEITPSVLQNVPGDTLATIEITRLASSQYVDDIASDLDSEISNIDGRVQGIEDVIPSSVDPNTNQLADKAWVSTNHYSKSEVDQKIQTETATFKGNWDTWGDVSTTRKDFPDERVDNNDYIVVIDASGYALYWENAVSYPEFNVGDIVLDGDEIYQCISPVNYEETPDAPRPSEDDGLEYWEPVPSNPEYKGTWRFKYSGNGTYSKDNWLPEYRINEEPLTPSQEAAINSGITSTKVGKLDALPTNSELQNTYMPKSGGTFTGAVGFAGEQAKFYKGLQSYEDIVLINKKLTGTIAPTMPLDAANKQYVDNVAAKKLQSIVVDFPSDVAELIGQGAALAIDPGLTLAETTTTGRLFVEESNKDLAFTLKNVSSANGEIAVATIGLHVADDGEVTGLIEMNSVGDLQFEGDFVPKVLVSGFGGAVLIVLPLNEHSNQYVVEGPVVSAWIDDFAQDLEQARDFTVLHPDILAEAISKKQDKLVSGTNIKTVNNQSLLGSGNISLASAAEVASIAEKIPAQASAQNQLADKNFVNSSIQTATATFKGNWDTWGDVSTTRKDFPDERVDNNDYMVVRDASGYAPLYTGPGPDVYYLVGDYVVVSLDGYEPGDLYECIADNYGDISPEMDTAHWQRATSNPNYEGTWRFKYVPSGDEYNVHNWHPEYQVNEKPLTAAQLAALNSNITEEKVAKLDGLPSTFPTEVFVAEYGVTPFADILAAYNANKEVICNYNRVAYRMSSYLISGGVPLYIYLNSPTKGRDSTTIAIKNDETWTSQTLTLERTLDKVSTLSGNETSTTKYPNTKAVADALGKWGVVSQTQTWTQQSDNSYTYAMSDLVYGAIPQANINLFVAAGATFNSVSGYFELNGLADISYEEMQDIYLYNLSINSKNTNRIFNQAYIRTVLPLSWYGRTVDGNAINDSGFTNAIVNTNTEVVVMPPKVGNSFYTATAVSALAYMSRYLKRIVNEVNYKGFVGSAFWYAYSLEEISIRQLQNNVSFKDSQRLSKDSLLYMINNEAATSAITITLHASVYAKCQSGGEWYSDINTALSVHTNVSLQSA